MCLTPESGYSDDKRGETRDEGYDWYSGSNKMDTKTGRPMFDFKDTGGGTQTN